MNLPLNNEESSKNSSYKILTLKGTSNQHYSYKVLNLNMKYHPNQQAEGTNILKEALQVKNVHNQITGTTNNTQNINHADTTKHYNTIENFYEINHKKRPTTSKWSGTLSNLSNRLSNQFNSTFIKSEHDKNKQQNKTNNKVNNLYFNNYIDMQFRTNNNFFKNNSTQPSIVTGVNLNKFINNLSNKEESNYITSTKNERFLKEQIISNERKNVKFLVFFHI